MPNGGRGVQAERRSIFFAFIGFDAVSTAAEECRNPRRDLPIGILGSLGICTIIYMLVAVVLIGMYPWNKLNVAEPLSVAMHAVHLDWAAGIVAFGSVIAHTAVLLVFQLGQPRILYAMSRDGLLPKVLAKTHRPLPHAARGNDLDRAVRGRRVRLGETRRDGRLVQHRHIVGLCDRVCGRARAALARSAPQQRFSHSLCPLGPAAGDRLLLLADAAGCPVAWVRFMDLAGCRTGLLRTVTGRGEADRG